VLLITRPSSGEVNWRYAFAASLDAAIRQVWRPEWPMRTAPAYFGLRRVVLYLCCSVEVVCNAISERWSNGHAEGQVSRLKALKRATDDGVGVTPLRARMLPLVQ
jgi:hypothetical protein